jgi:hypothetical protein
VSLKGIFKKELKKIRNENDYEPPLRNNADSCRRTPGSSRNADLEKQGNGFNGGVRDVR